MSELFKIGQIINTHGIKGEVKVYPLTDDVQKFKKYKTLLIGGVEKNILGVKFQKDRVILKIDGVDDMNTAETYKQKYIEVKREEEDALPENTYYVSDLKKCSVFDEEGKNLGKIFDVISTKNNDVYWIKEPKELLVPVLPDIVLNVDVENEKIVIKCVGEWMDED